MAATDFCRWIMDISYHSMSFRIRRMQSNWTPFHCTDFLVSWTDDSYFHNFWPKCVDLPLPFHSPYFAHEPMRPTFTLRKSTISCGLLWCPSTPWTFAIINPMVRNSACWHMRPSSAMWSNQTNACGHGLLSLSITKPATLVVGPRRGPKK